MANRKILMATTNPGKAREIQKLLDGLPVEIINLNDFEGGEIPEAPEDMETFEENAIQKARHYGGLTGLPTIAEDSGLTIPALDGWPGVRSARIADTDEERIRLVLERMQGKPDDDWLAMFVSVAAFYDPESGRTETFMGVSQGTIVEEPRGENGFGYDPIFRHPGYGRTMAELSTEEKNAVSHRGQSFRAFAKWLKENIVDV